MHPSEFQPIEYLHRDGLVRVRRRSLDWIAHARKSHEHRWLALKLPRLYVTAEDAMVAAILALGLEEPVDEPAEQHDDDLRW